LSEKQQKQLLAGSNISCRKHSSLIGHGTRKWLVMVVTAMMNNIIYKKEFIE